MYKIRIIPVLLLRRWGLEKSIRFQEFVYVGSPINAARVFNGFNVDELILLDIAATGNHAGPNLEVVAQIAGETEMPFTVGGGIDNIETIRALLNVGVDRVCINTAALERPSFIHEAATVFGSQCIVISIDARKESNGTYQVYSHGGARPTGKEVVAWAKTAAECGAGEILLTSIDRDGTMQGYDLELIRRVADAVPIPVIACGGAGSVAHFREAIDIGHASAAAAGSFFQFFGPRRTVLLTYPEDEVLYAALGKERVRAKDPFREPRERYAP